MNDLALMITQTPGATESVIFPIVMIAQAAVVVAVVGWFCLGFAKDR